MYARRIPGALRITPVRAGHPAGPPIEFRFRLPKRLRLRRLFPFRAGFEPAPTVFKEFFSSFFAKSFIRACRGRLSWRPAEFPENFPQPHPPNSRKISPDRTCRIPGKFPPIAPAEFPAIYLLSPYGPPPTAAHRHTQQFPNNDFVFSQRITPRTGRTPGRPAKRITENLI